MKMQKERKGDKPPEFQSAWPSSSDERDEHAAADWDAGQAPAAQDSPVASDPAAWSGDINDTEGSGLDGATDPGLGDAGLGDGEPGDAGDTGDPASADGVAPGGGYEPPTMTSGYEPPTMTSGYEPPTMT